jgi:hypothetical protein
VLAAIEAADGEGQVVMVALILPGWAELLVHRREYYHQAVVAMPAGFVLQKQIKGGPARTESFGTEAAPIGAIPAVAVSKEVGASLERTVFGDAVTLRVKRETATTTAQNFHASLAR